jgi:hypothetical protein
MNQITNHTNIGRADSQILKNVGEKMKMESTPTFVKWRVLRDVASWFVSPSVVVQFAPSKRLREFAWSCQALSTIKPSSGELELLPTDTLVEWREMDETCESCRQRVNGIY